MFGLPDNAGGFYVKKLLDLTEKACKQKIKTELTAIPQDNILNYLI